MSHSPVLLDLTELLGNPLRTGIQRVEREIIRNWPGHRPLLPCRFDAASQRFVSVSEAVFDVLGSQTTHPGEAERQLLLPHLLNFHPLTIGELSRGLFNAEVFYDAGRAAKYRSICRDPSAKVSWLLYDFIPYLRPEDYPPTTSRSCMHYLYAMSAVHHVCAISELTQQQYRSRITRDENRECPAFPLGGDGLEMEKQQFSVSRREFTYIGTIEPRKNVGIILEAFELLWQRGVDARLTIIGRHDVRSQRELSMLNRLSSESRLNYLGHVDDATIRAVLRKTRATLFLSSAEGFGIPPLESLSVGVPAIISSGLPSMSGLPQEGRITLSSVSADTVAAAIVQSLNDDVAAQLWNETARLTIPTWRDFTTNIAEWLQ